MAERYEVQGAASLQKKLINLQAAASGRAIRAAANFAMTPVLKAARANAPKGDKPHKTYKGRTVAPGFLGRSIKKKSKLARNKGRAFAWIQVDGEAWYGRLIEKGYRPGKRSKSVKRASRKTAGGLSDAALSSLGDNRGKVPARPWLAPAFNRNRALLKERYSQKLRERIKIEAAK